MRVAAAVARSPAPLACQPARPNTCGDHPPCGVAQFVREFAKLGLTKSVGGVLGLALSRELTPVVTCIILAGVPPSPSHPSSYMNQTIHHHA